MTPKTANRSLPRAIASRRGCATRSIRRLVCRSRDVRADSLAASKGATDFGEYFTYFSMFLVWSALLLAALFFRLAVEQRARELGLLRAVGFSTARVRRLFLAEGLALALAGARHRRRGGARLRGVDDAGPAHLVDRRRRDDVAHAARDAVLAGGRGGWRAGGGDGLHLVDAARARARVGAGSAGGRAQSSAAL